jgi:Ca2+-dependent lipid-binding protein
MGEVIDRLEMKIVEAEDLLKPNMMAPSPYVEVTLGLDTKKTKQVNESASPVWNSPTMIFSQLVSNDLESILVYVRHKDIFSGKEQSLGVAIIPLATCYGAPNVEIDDWYDLEATSEMEEPPSGRVHILATYFNSVDDDVLMSIQQAAYDTPNLLQIKVSDAGELGDRSSAYDAFVIVQVGNLRKETKVAKRSTTPQWDEDLEIPTTDGSQMVELTVRHASILR